MENTTDELAVQLPRLHLLDSDVVSTGQWRCPCGHAHSTQFFSAPSRLLVLSGDCVPFICYICTLTPPLSQTHAVHICIIFLYCWIVSLFIIMNVCSTGYHVAPTSVPRKLVHVRVWHSSLPWKGRPVNACVFNPGPRSPLVIHRSKHVWRLLPIPSPHVAGCSVWEHRRVRAGPARRLSRLHVEALVPSAVCTSPLMSLQFSSPEFICLILMLFPQGSGDVHVVTLIALSFFQHPHNYVCCQVIVYHPYVAFVLSLSRQTP